MIHEAGARSAGPVPGRFGGGADRGHRPEGVVSGRAPGLASPLAIALFGPFDVRLQGRPLPQPRSQKTHWLLALLALQEGRTLERAWLAGTLWPDSTEQQAARNLRSSLWYLRQALGPEARRLVAPSVQTLRLDLVGAETDLLIFDEAIARGDTPSLETAIALRRGPLLQGCEEEWVLQEREAREQAYLTALETLATHAMARGEHAEAVRYLRRLLAVDPLRESVQRALMQALASAGEYAAATQVYRNLRLLLHRDLNAAPDPETTALYQQLRAEAREGGRGRREEGATGRADAGTMTAGPPLSGRPLPPSPRHPVTSSAAPRLPSPWSSFIGREREIAEVAACLARERLVTLTGMGGVGKTRLAIRVAEEVAEAVPDGPCLVGLAALSDPALVPQALAAALEVPEQRDRPVTATLQEFLRPKQSLLVLDNCEHLIEACAQLVDALLSQAPHLRIMATSRQSLGLRGEVVWPVPPLSLPAMGVQAPTNDDQPTTTDERQLSNTSTPERLNAPTPERTLESEAVRLFVERAREAQPGFRVTTHNIPLVAQICQRLDGIPLALELAAARLQALSVEQILERLEDRFRLLTSGGRTSPPRQQTLRATLDWSYDLLDAPERVLLHRLCVFVGGFTLEAAEAVCGECGGERPDLNQDGQQDVLDLLTALVDRSLVQYEGPGDRESGDGAGRYRLLETVRWYARERLLNSGEAAAVRDRHLAFYLQLAETAGSHLRGLKQIAWLERLDTEHDNLRAALEWSSDPSAVGSGQPADVGGPLPVTDAVPRSRRPAAHCPLPTGLRLAGALIGFWEIRGHLEEGRQRLAAVLERAGPWRRSHAGARALEGAGVLAFLQWDYDASRTHYSESLEIYRELGDRRGTARTLGHLGLSAYDQGDSPAARSLWEESMAIARELGEPACLPGALVGLARVAYYQGDIALARALLEESLAIERELGNPTGLALALMVLGEIICRLEEYPLAHALLEESLAIHRALGDRRHVADSLVMLGTTQYAQQEYAAARTHLEEALAIQRELGDGRRAAVALDRLADMARRQGDYPTGLRYIEEALVLWRAARWQVGVMHALGLLGHLARGAGDYRRAHTAYSESLILRQQAHDLYLVINSLEDFAELAACEGQWERMTRLLGAALAQREAVGKPLLPRDRADYDQMLTRARGALAEGVIAAAWDEGRTMMLGEAVHDALRTPVRVQEGRDPTPTAAILDSQTVQMPQERAHGCDAGKTI